MPTGRKDRITQSFSASAAGYDGAAEVQWLVAQRLTKRIAAALPALPTRILEIGCGTGFLSIGMHQIFPSAALTLTDIAPSMLDRCRARVGVDAEYLVVDGEMPHALAGRKFDLIVSSLAFQWFVDLPRGLERLAALLAPGGRMMFATLGPRTFLEWRQAHEQQGLSCGTPSYPGLLPWPDGFECRQDEEILLHPYADGHDFVRSLKALGAGEPAPGHRPLSPGAFRKVLTSLGEGFSATYHILYGTVGAP